MKIHHEWSPYFVWNMFPFFLYFYPRFLFIIIILFYMFGINSLLAIEIFFTSSSSSTSSYTGGFLSV